MWGTSRAALASVRRPLGLHCRFRAVFSVSSIADVANLICCFHSLVVPDENTLVEYQKALLCNKISDVFLLLTQETVAECHFAF